MSERACIVTLAILGLSLPACADGDWYAFSDKYERWQKDRPFVLGALHNSVPEDHALERAHRLKAAGCNTLIWWKPGNAVHMFAAAREAGIGWACGSVGGLKTIGEAMKVDGNAFIMVGDEPGDDELEEIAALTDEVRATYPRTPLFTNLSFMKVSHDRYVELCRPDILSFDHYPLLRNGTTQESYLYNVAWGRHSARKYRLPYWLFLQAYGREEEKPSYAYRVPDQADLRFLVFTHLAHGGAGINFFHYYGYQGSMIEDTGVEREASGPTSAHRYENTVASRAWFAVRDVAPEVHVLARALVNLRSKGEITYAGDGRLWDHRAPKYSKHNRDDGYRCSRFGGHGSLLDVRVVDGEDMGLLVGLFVDRRGEEYFMIVNLAHGINQSKLDAARRVRIEFDDGIERIERLNRMTGRVETLRTTTTDQHRVLDVTLEGGTGDLFKWSNGRRWAMR
ncbi:MAG: hypothetical protein CMJ18_00200 [Phycisphaeraceae bacterium]|nr:hypothetical protein [Phycisphaeraceae bacterium]